MDFKKEHVLSPCVFLLRVCVCACKRVLFVEKVVS